MFERTDPVITEVVNPLKVTKSSMLEFSIGELDDTGLYRIMKIIELDFGERAYARYLLHSRTEDTEYVFEVVPGNNGQLEAYLYSMVDTVPFSQEFLDVAGQKFLTTPDGAEYERCVMPEEEDRLDGLEGRVRVYNLETGQIEKQSRVKVWDYQREVDGRAEYLNIEMSEETGMFRIFTGEIIEDIFYKFYQTSKGGV